MPDLTSTSVRRVLIVPALLLLTGCQRAPSIDILGSFFPIWIVCILLGIVLAVLARQILGRFGMQDDLGPSVLVYPSMSALFAFVIWLIFFR